MKHKLSAIVLAAATLLACNEAPTSLDLLDPSSFSVIGSPNPNGAIVLNKGEASQPFTGFCTFAGRLTNDVTAVRMPNDRGLLSCHWADFPGVVSQNAINIKGFTCFLDFFGFSVTTKSHFTYNPSGGANMHCTFDGIP